jgi:putative NADH-flavin reductase
VLKHSFLEQRTYSGHQQHDYRPILRMSTAIKNVLIAGASGSVGLPILNALLDESSFNITILSRASSTATFPPDIPVIKVSDEHTVKELTSAVKNQDAVIIALTTSAVSADGKDGLAIRLIDAAVAAGVKRFIPSEFGANNLDPRARSLVSVYDIKGNMLEYLIAKANQSNGELTWTSISCGSWLDWALNPAKSGNFLGIDVKARTATVYDSGNARFAITTSRNAGLAVVRALVHAGMTANKQIFLNDFTGTTRDIVSSLEKQTGEKFKIAQKDSAVEIKALKEKFDGGDLFPILAMSFGADIEIGYDFEKEQEIWNDKLGLPKVTLDEVVEEAIELAQRT